MYWKKYNDEYNLIYSCDMIRFRLELSHYDDKKAILSKLFNNPCRIDIKTFPINNSPFKYRQLFTIDYGKSTMSVGLYFNGATREDSLKGFLEFNPNKVCNNDLIYHDLYMIFSACVSYEVIRWDLAIDIPYARNFCYLAKDERNYELKKVSQLEYSEYLGARNNVGRCKLYNKTIESSLDYDLTRFEITLGGFDNAADDLRAHFPNVYITKYQSDFDVEYGKLSATQKTLIRLLKQCDNPFIEIMGVTYSTRKKIEPYVMGDYFKLEYDILVIYQLISDLKKLLDLNWLLFKGTEFQPYA